MELEVGSNAEHDKAVDELFAGYGNRENRRVPVYFASDEDMWLGVAGGTFLEFYKDPRVQVATQLEGQKWMRDNVVADQKQAYPERWDVCPRLWNHETEFFGCEVVYQDDDYAWAMPLAGTKDDILKRVAGIDPLETVRNSNLYKLYCDSAALADGMQFEGRPVHVGSPGDGTDGVFTKAVEVLGADRLCREMTDDPGFVHQFLALITDKTIARMQAWRRLMGMEDIEPNEYGWGCADDSLVLISGETYRQFVLPQHKRLYGARSAGPYNSMHLCGRAMQHYRCLHEDLSIRTIDGPGTFVDHGTFLAELGEDFAFNAQMDHSVLLHGSKADVERMIRGLMTAGAKQPGHFQIMGFIVRNTPMDNVRAAYAAALRYGEIDDHLEK